MKLEEKLIWLTLCTNKRHELNDLTLKKYTELWLIVSSL
jgi:hypothetical protein